MFGKVIKKIFGSRNDRIIKGLSKNVQKINALEETLSSLTDEELRQKTTEFKQRFADGETLDQLLPEAFAVVREGSTRVMGMRHYDVQLIGGMILHEGKIAEMRTGEGKTLVATLPAYLNALSGKGVHVVTVNDYLASRDAEWMGKLYQFLGLTVGTIVANMSHEERKQAYEADITYATNNELGFDYLRDNMAFSMDRKVQRPPNFAIVDEVDSILIDEARTPLIISGAASDSSELYQRINELVPLLKKQEEEDGEGDFSLEEKNKQVHLTEAGHENIEKLFVEHGLMNEDESLYDTGNINLLHHLDASLRAHYLFEKDVDYIVRNNQVVIVDEFTGRTMEGRRWSNGLHQAVEAKEGVPIQQESQTVASITYQNYFRLYEKLAGMTGTADTEAFEFQQIYALEVVVVPTHKPMVRDDRGDLVYLTTEEKYDAILEDIRDCVKRKQPVLVGTASIESSEHISNILQKEKIPHEVLNAKQHEREAHIVAQAGRPGAITIATNMAGRGTDIVLGGNLQAELAEIDPDDEVAQQRAKEEWKKRHEKVLRAGGLHIIGTERHESRRIDNQLRGRSGRQGDPGSTRFYLSLEDNLMRIFASGRVAGLMQKLGMEKGEAIEHPWVTKAIENAQRKVEAHNFDIRKNLLEFDDVANDQRKVIYEQRDELMSVDDVSDTADAMMRDVLNQVIDNFIPPGSIDEQWDVSGLEEALKNDFSLEAPVQEWLDQDDELNEEGLRQRLYDHMKSQYAEKNQEYGEDSKRYLEKKIMLDVLDQCWKEHLAAMDYLRQSIGLRGYAQKNPKQEYKREAFEMFSQMLDRIKYDVVVLLMRAKIISTEQQQAMEQKALEEEQKMQAKHMDFNAFNEHAEESGKEENAESSAQPFVRDGRKIGRNDPCPCGSGKKYKQCHGKLT